MPVKRLPCKLVLESREVEPTSAAEFGIATALLVVVTLCATLLPARRAARTHAAVVLRGE